MPAMNTAPANPEKGFLWLDDSAADILVLREFDGAAWTEVDRAEPKDIARLEAVVAAKARAFEPELIEVERPVARPKSAKPQRPWFAFKAAEGAIPEIAIYDEIGFWGTTARDFMEQLKPLAEAPAIIVRINSPGGDAFDGLTIHNALARFKGEVRVHVDGLAASAASVIAMAGSTITMAENAMMMIHEPWGIVIGTADDMAAMGEALGKLNSAIVTTYCRRSDMDPEECAALLKAETWLTADEAIAHGLADEKKEPAQMRARFDLSAYAKVPAQLLDAMSAGAAEARAAEIARLCTDAGMAGETDGFTNSNLSADAVGKRIAAMQEIRTLCQAAKHEDLFATLKDKPVEEARKTLFDLVLKEDEGRDIRSSLAVPPGKGDGQQPSPPAGKPAFNPVAIHKSRGPKRRR